MTYHGTAGNATLVSFVILIHFPERKQLDLVAGKRNLEYSLKLDIN